MDKYKYTLQTNLSDLNVYQCGTQICEAGHSNGPAVRPYYLLHFIISGSGIFQTGGQTYHLHSGDAFLICPNKLSYYCSDNQTPWTYAWIALDGIKAEEYFSRAGLTSKTPIYHAVDTLTVQRSLLKVVNYTKTNSYSELRLLGFLYLFLAELTKQSASASVAATSPKEEYLQKIVKYIHVHIWDRITVAELAAHVGLDRSYLYKIFKQSLKTSPQEFILNAKLQHACGLLRTTDMTIGSIARSVGYQDQLAFSKIFKQKYGCSPKQYRFQKGENQQ